MSILFDQNATAAKFSDAIKAGMAEAQAGGIAIEDHLPGVLIPLIHQTLLEASSDVSGALKPLLEAVADLQITINASVGVLASESAAWRAIFQRFDLSPPEAPK